jgi:hypothetical protein
MAWYAEKRGESDRRVFEMGELDGFYVSSKIDRAVHITFEKKDVIVIDIYDTATAAIALVCCPINSFTTFCHSCGSRNPEK